MNRLKLITTDNGQEFELFKDEEGDYLLLAAGETTYVGPFTTQSRAEDEADYLSIL